MKDQLHTRLEQYSENPPAGVWEGVSAALDEEMPAFAQKLRSFEAVPPGKTWETITAELPVTKVRSMYPKRMFQYAAAAVILIAAILAVRMVVNTPVKEEVSYVEPARTEKENTTVPPAPADTKTATPEPRQPARPTREKNTQPATIAKTLQQPKGNRYVTVSNDDGKKVRLSKKVAPVFDCAEAKRTASKICQENIRSLQEKVGASISVTSDFAALVEMIKSLEKQQ
jgi:hypothetical protein